MWLALATGCSVWISAAEQDARLADLGYVDSDGDGRPDVPDDDTDGDDTDDTDDTDDDTDGRGPGTWDDPDILVEKLEDDLQSSGTGMNVSLQRDVDGALSRMVYCEAPGAGGAGEVNRIDDGATQYAYEQDDPYDTPVRGGRYPNGVPALLPWSPDWPVDDGQIGYDLELVTGGLVDCWAIEKYGTAPEAGTLRLRVVLSSDEWDEGDLTAAPYDAAMQKVDEAFALAGITLDRTLETLDGACADGTLDSYDAAAAMTACGVDVGERELTLFLVDELAPALLEPGGHDGFGLAPGVPFLGSGAMGAAFVPLRALREEGDSGFGRDVAHAIGHFLGLWELWEYEANRGDPLSDTAACTASVRDDFTACPSGTHDNVMFPTPTPTSGFAFTPDQGWVMRRAALVR